MKNIIEEVGIPGAVTSRLINDLGESSVAGRFLDLTLEFCPKIFEKFKGRLELMAPGDLIEIAPWATDHLLTMPVASQYDGHQVEAACKDGDRFHLLIRKLH